MQEDGIKMQEEWKDPESSPTCVYAVGHKDGNFNLQQEATTSQCRNCVDIQGFSKGSTQDILLSELYFVQYLRHTAHVRHTF